MSHKKFVWRRRNPTNDKLYPPGKKEKYGPVQVRLFLAEVMVGSSKILLTLEDLAGTERIGFHCGPAVARGDNPHTQGKIQQN